MGRWRQLKQKYLQSSNDSKLTYTQQDGLDSARVTELIERNSRILLQSNSNLIRNSNRLSLASGRPIRVLFIVHNIEVWPTLSPICKRMTADKDFDVMVVSCPRKYPGSSVLQGEEVVSEGLVSDGIEHTRLNSQDEMKDLRYIMRFNPDIIFRQSKWDEDLPSIYSTDNLMFARLYYIPYGVMPLSDSSFGEDKGQDIEYESERMFVINEEVADLYRKNDPSNKKTLTVSGNPRIDYIKEAKPSWPIVSKNKFKIIWSAHHSIFTGWSDFGAFLTTYQPMLDYAKGHPDIDILFSMHPGLKGAFERLSRKNPKEYRDVERFMSEWDSLPNTGVLRDGGYIPAMKASSMCITDGLSLLVEYQLTKKPLVYIERQGHTPFSSSGKKVMKGAHSVDSGDMEGVWRYVEEFKSGVPDSRLSYQKETIKFLSAHKSAADNIVRIVKGDCQ